MNSMKLDPRPRFTNAAPTWAAFGLALLLFPVPVFAHGGINALAGLAELMMIVLGVCCVGAVFIAHLIVKKYENKWLYLSSIPLAALLTVTLFVLSAVSI